MIYDYKCLSCGNPFQFDAPMNSRVVKGRHSKSFCPKCKSKNVKKTIHRAEIIFKGSGFYSTDNRK